MTPILLPLVLLLAPLDPPSAPPEISGPRLRASTLLGGSGSEAVAGIVAEASGSFVVVGTTRSRDFPVTDESARGNLGGEADLFVVRLNSDLSRLQYAARWGGEGRERAVAVLPGEGGELLVAGITDSSSSAAGAERSFGATGGQDLFIIRISADLETIETCLRFGGTGAERGAGFAVDGAGNVYLSGTSTSADLPVTDDAFDRRYDPSGFLADYQAKVFVARFAPDFSELLACTWLGGTEGEAMGHLAIDSRGDVVVAGSTRSIDFPTTPDAFDTSLARAQDPRAGDAFVAKLTPELDELVASTLLGGPGPDWAYHVAVDAEDRIFLTGHGSIGFPSTAGVVDPSFNDVRGGAGSDAFLVRFDAGLSEIEAATFLGSRGEDIGNVGVPDGAGGIWTMGVTRGEGFPTNAGAHDRTFARHETPWEGDAFVAHLDDSFTSLHASTLLGGSANEGGSRALAILGPGRVVIAGTTMSADFDTTSGCAQPRLAGSVDVFVALLDPLAESTPEAEDPETGGGGSPSIRATTSPRTGPPTERASLSPRGAGSDRPVEDRRRRRRRAGVRGGGDRRPVPRVRPRRSGDRVQRARP